MFDYLSYSASSLRCIAFEDFVGLEDPMLLNRKHHRPVADFQFDEGRHLLLLHLFSQVVPGHLDPPAVSSGKCCEETTLRIFKELFGVSRVFERFHEFSVLRSCCSFFVPKVGQLLPLEHWRCYTFELISLSVGLL